MIAARPHRLASSSRGILARLDTPASCLLVVAVVLSFFTLGILVQHGFDPSAFIVAGDRFSDIRDLPPGVAVLKDSAGYDGQFYYRLALDPFTAKATDFGITFDHAAYRHQRILYPLIVHAITVGNAAFVPIAMIATNFVFFCLMAWICGSLARTSGRHALWGLLVVGFPGFLIVYSRDLIEIVDATFLLGSILLIRRGRPHLATVALTLAVLTRETSLVVAVSAAIVLGWDRLRGRTTAQFGWDYVAVPIVAFCALQCALFVNWGDFPVSAGDQIMAAAPLTGVASAWAPALAASASDRFVQTVALIFVAGSALIIAYHLFVADGGRTERLACLVYCVMLASLGALVWREDIGFMRVYTQAYVFGAIVVLTSRSTRGRLVLSSLVLITWAVEFGRFIAIKHLLRSVIGTV